MATHIKGLRYEGCLVGCNAVPEILLYSVESGSVILFYGYSGLKQALICCVVFRQHCACCCANQIAVSRCYVFTTRRLGQATLDGRIPKISVCDEFVC
jgi:hypothetical protein